MNSDQPFSELSLLSETMSLIHLSDIKTFPEKRRHNFNQTTSVTEKGTEVR